MELIGKNKKLKTPAWEFDDLGGHATLQESEIEINAKLKRGVLKQEEDANAELRPKWMVSNPIGGRMINADPVFAQDEKYAYSPSCRILC